jgi:DNA mismatch repair ATPase MutS
MERQEIPSSRDGSGSAPDNHGHTSEEWAELLARTVAHLAAQLTMTQIRLRALATELNARGVVDEEAVRTRVGQIASLETGVYLRENLGEALADVIDLESLESEISSFLQS